MRISDRIRAELRADPTVSNRVLVEKYDCTSALVSKMRKQLGIPLQPWQCTPLQIVLPVYMLGPLGRLAKELGSDVTIQDYVIAVLNDCIAEGSDDE